jgi:glycosyltransferase involved in cell wall biosynthesis
MKIAFYAPLKPPDHPVPSGDRQMGRHLMQALTHGGHEVRLESRVRTYLREPSPQTLAEIRARCSEEVAALARRWTVEGPADLWFSYHPYYKAPDLIGPEIATQFGIPYVTCEASYSAKRDRDDWKVAQQLLKDGLRGARLNLCFTDRDRKGLGAVVDKTTLFDIKPFTDVSNLQRTKSRTQTAAGALITVAMMRDGDKFDSYRMLAASLGRIVDLPWHLTIVGTGPKENEVRELFAPLPRSRLTWTGEVAVEEISTHLSKAAIFVWPGCGEAYGLAYLEAQAAGLPVVAQNTAGVPSVVVDGETGLLVPEGDVEAFGRAMRDLIVNPSKADHFGRRAQQFVFNERSVEHAASRLNVLLSTLLDEATPVSR